MHNHDGGFTSFITNKGCGSKFIQQFTYIIPKLYKFTSAPLLWHEQYWLSIEVSKVKSYSSIEADDKKTW